MDESNGRYLVSYGGGVNSTALCILLHQGKLPYVKEWTPIFADTGNEKPATYSFIQEVFGPWLENIGHPLIVVKPPETVLGRWQRIKTIGSRHFRSCTDHAKIRPIKKYAKKHGPFTQMLGIDAGEPHRAQQDQSKFLYPLIDLDIDRAGCVEVIEKAGMPVPPKSGCWHCPFMRVQEILDLARDEPAKFDLIDNLENDAADFRGNKLFQWGAHSAEDWRERALNESWYADEWEELFPVEQCGGCYDG